MLAPERLAGAARFRRTTATHDHKNHDRPYGDLVRQYIALNKMQRFEKIPIARYNNFVADFLAAEKTATRADVIAD